MTFFPDDKREKKVVTKFQDPWIIAKIPGSLDHRSKSLDHTSNPWIRNVVSL